jgi:heme-degrading monooxygenase HmoA
MIEIIWTYRVRQNRLTKFLEYYSASGVWAGLFCTAPEYRGTDLLRDTEDPFRFATVDHWDSYEAYDAFLRTRHAEYERIDAACAYFTLEETKIGCFEH